MSTITTLTEDEVNNQGMPEFNKPDILETEPNQIHRKT